MTSQSMRRAGLLAVLILMAAPVAAQQPPEAVLRDLELEEGPSPTRGEPGWTAPRKVVVLDMWDEGLAERMGEVAPGVEVVVAKSLPEAVREVADADGFIGFANADVVRAGRRLRWIQYPSAGVERLVGMDELRERGVVVSNAQRIYGPPIAEHVAGLTLALARRIPAAVRLQDRKDWEPAAFEEAPKPVELRGQTALIVGLGGLGTESGRLLHGLGMRVVATRRSGRGGPDFVDYVGLPNELHRLAGEAHVIVNALPLTDETRGLFDDRFFDAVKRGALFINVGRGGSVDQAALIRALRDGRLGGAGLDVTTPEPLPPGDPLWEAPNLIITPHVASASGQDYYRLWVVARENLRRFAAGERLLSVVDLERGY